MKKGLKNTIASMALAGMSMFGGIKQASAAFSPETSEAKAKITEIGKTLASLDKGALYEEKAQELLSAQDGLLNFLKKPIPYKGIHDGKRGEEAIEEGAKRLQKFLIVDADGKTYIDLSKCDKLTMLVSADGISDWNEFGLNYSDPHSPLEDGVCLRFLDGGLKLSHWCLSTDGFCEGGDTLFKVDLKKKTFQMGWWRTGGKALWSPEMSYAPEKGKTAAKTLTPAAKKAVAEKRVHN